MEQGVIMRVGTVFIIGLIGISVAGAPAAAQEGPEAVLLGTYTQNQACKGDGSDPALAKKLVKVGDTQVDSNFGPCVFGEKSWSGKVLKATATCKNTAGTEFDVSLSFTLKDDKTVEFVEEGSQYKSVLYRCAGAANVPAAAPKK
jgi:hypothetical protein